MALVINPTFSSVYKINGPFQVFNNIVSYATATNAVAINYSDLNTILIGDPWGFQVYPITRDSLGHIIGLDKTSGYYYPANPTTAAYRGGLLYLNDQSLIYSSSDSNTNQIPFGRTILRCIAAPGIGQWAGVEGSL